MTFEPLLFVFPSLAFRRASRRALRAEMPDSEVATVLQRAAVRRAALAATPRDFAPGVTFIMRYFEWACALYQALLVQGWSAERAGACIESIQWAIFEPVSRIQFRLSRLRSRSPIRRAGWIMDLMFRTIFARPYRRVVLPSGDGVAFDVVACPLAALYREQGVPELTRYAACSLDFRMARQWGVGFARTTTIAEGQPRCDFRFSASAGEERVDQVHDAR